MPNVDISALITIIVSLFGGGVVGVVIKAFTEKRKINAEANNTNIKRSFSLQLIALNQVYKSISILDYTQQ